MKKASRNLIFKLLLTALAACLAIALVACSDQTAPNGSDSLQSHSAAQTDGNSQGGTSQTDGTSQSADASSPSGGTTVNMTDSYKSGRQAFYDVSGIWLPEIENVELLSSSDVDGSDGVICFDFLGDRATFESTYAYLKDLLHKASDFGGAEEGYREDTNGGYWEFVTATGTRKFKTNIDISWDADNAAGTAIYVNLVVREYVTVTLTTTEGGTATLKMGSKTFENNVAVVTPGDHLIFTATAANDHEFKGWYVGEELLSDANPYSAFETPKTSVTVKGVFEAAADNMDAGYKAAKNALYGMSGIVLPALENATTNAKTTQITVDPDGLRDEFQCEFVFATAEEAKKAYIDFRAAIMKIDGDPEETESSDSFAMDIWSVLYADATVPYRDDVMMNYQGGTTNFFLMWRKQPIVFYHVSTDGDGGSAYISYIGPDYQERRVDSYWEISDAFHGKVCAVADSGYKFSGWYVKGTLVSTEATYAFNYEKEDVNFTDITFVAKFEENKVTMTESYAAARSAFNSATGLTLPELANVGGAYFAEDEMVDIGGSTAETGATNDTLTAVNAAFESEIGFAPVYSGGAYVWTYTVTKDNKTFVTEVRTVFQAESSGGLVVVMYRKNAVDASFMTARAQFKAVTGVELPVMAGLTVDEFPYKDGDTSYCFDITGGDMLGYSTYTAFKAFFDGALVDWTVEGPTTAGEYTNVDYKSAAGDWIGLTWDSTNESVYINAVMSDVTVYKTYAEARAALKTTFGIELPDYSDVELKWNSFKKDGTEVTFGFSKTSFTKSDFDTVLNAMKAKLGDPSSSDDSEFGSSASWTVGGLYYSLDWDPVGKTLDINITVAAE